MDNYFIAGQFSMLAKLMDIHGDNSFKAKTYSVAAFNIEKLTVQLADLPPAKISAIKGIGESTGRKIVEVIRDGSLKALEEYVLKTPPGILELLSIKGLGPKKIAVIWKQMNIESPGELLYACNENRLARYKGFGDKSQQSIRQALEFYLQNQGSHLYAQVEKFAKTLDQALKKNFAGDLFELTGAFRRQLEVIEQLEWVTTAGTDALADWCRNLNLTEEELTAETCSFSTSDNIMITFHSRPKEQFYATLFDTSASEAFLGHWYARYKEVPANPENEEAIFIARGVSPIPAFLREDPIYISHPAHATDRIISPADIRGIIHSHSDWSDGSHSVEFMAQACIDKGYEYLVISDHSKTAAYANGLQEERVREQHAYIDELNSRLAPFRIFKSIESDILGDGSLDYAPDILASFDLVIASIHSNLKMTEEKAMSRLLAAIRNPYTTIMGHLTGRLLLSRPSYPVNHERIIDACAEHGVAIEVNANPRRLDMEWRYIRYALEKGVMISVNPDAHDVDEFDLCKYGVLVAQKGGLTPDRNLSSLTLAQFSSYLAARAASRKK